MKINITPSKTYANEKNVEKAIEEKGYSHLRYLICEKDGRFYPVFIGEKAAAEGVHFNFCVVA